MSKNNLEKTIARLSRLTASQLGLLNGILDTFERPIASHRLSTSDVVNKEFLIAFGDVLKLHHSMSQDYLDKTPFRSSYRTGLQRHWQDRQPS